MGDGSKRHPNFGRVLSPTRGRVLKMKADGLTIREIAGALGITTQAVHIHLNRQKAIEEAAQEQAS